MKVMVSSVIQGFEDFRAAAVDAARVLGHDVLRSEDLAAGAEPAERACLNLVRRADVVLLLLGARYGSKTSRGLAPTHEEYREAREAGRDVLAFVQTGTPEPAQAALIEEVREWATGMTLAKFTTPAQLRDEVIRALKDLELSRSRGQVDPAEMTARAQERLRAAAAQVNRGSLLVAVAPGPAHALVRPRDMAADELQQTLEQDALYGAPGVLRRGEGVRTRIIRGSIAIEQTAGQVLFDADGTIVVAQQAETSEGHLPMIVQEDVVERIEGALAYAVRTLDRIDPTGRCTDVAVVAALAKVGYSGWVTRSQRAADPDRLSMNVQAPELEPVSLRPPTRRRRALVAERRVLAEDLTELLRQAALGRSW